MRVKNKNHLILFYFNQIISLENKRKRKQNLQKVINLRVFFFPLNFHQIVLFKWMRKNYVEENRQHQN